MFDYKKARAYTKEHIKGNTGKIIGYAILYSIFQGIISSLITDLPYPFNIVGGVVVAGLTTPIQVGLFRIITNLVNKKSVSFEMLFSDYKYFFTLFIIGIVGNAIIAVANNVIPILLFFVNCAYVGLLYVFIYNSDLSLGDLFNKYFEKFKLFFTNSILLELSYVLPIIILVVLYAFVMAITITVLAFSKFNELLALIEEFKFLELFSTAIPIAIITIVFAIVLLVMVIMIIPKLWFAEAVFYSDLKEGKVKEAKVVEEDKKFCTNCGAKVEGKFCPSCGHKIKE